MPKTSKRTLWKRSELDILFLAFYVDRYLTEERAINLAEKLNRPLLAVKTWFRNKRRKSRGGENSRSSQDRQERMQDRRIIAEIVNDLMDRSATMATTMLPYTSLRTPYFPWMYDFSRFQHQIYPFDLLWQPVDYTIGQPF